MICGYEEDLWCSRKIIQEQIEVDGGLYIKGGGCARSPDFVLGKQGSQSYIVYSMKF